jgi:hypothetical protein
VNKRNQRIKIKKQEKTQKKNEAIIAFERGFTFSRFQIVCEMEKEKKTKFFLFLLKDEIRNNKYIFHG